jgi:membrane-bound lytic murein transglycosylase D
MKKTINFNETSFMKWPLVFLLGIGLFAWPTIFGIGESAKSPLDPSLISSLTISTSLEFCGEPAPLDVQEVRERFEKEFLLTLWDKPQVILWLKRSRRYLPYIEEMLQQNDMPDDLKYVAVAESALRPHASSHKGALGFWQFIQHTGRHYGLVVNSRIDERRNLFASTQAAIKYFQELHKTFGSWTLAAAAYNMGENGLADEIQEQGAADYYYLYLPLETQRYIFRILSIKLIFADPEKYGFHLSDEDYYPPLEFDRIQLNCRQDAHLRVIAQAAKTHFKVIKDLNPEIRGYSLPIGKHTILIPKGASEDFEVRYHYLLTNQSVDGQNERIYVVHDGDTLSSVAERFDVTLETIIVRNHLDPQAPLHPGDTLIVPRREEPIDLEQR